MEQLKQGDQVNLKDEETLNNEKEMLQEKHPKVYHIVTFLDEDDVELVGNFFFKRPDRAEYNTFMKIYTGTSIINASEYFAKSCWIGGDPLEILLTNDYALRSMEYAISEILFIRQSFLKKN